MILKIKVKDREGISNEWFISDITEINKLNDDSFVLSYEEDKEEGFNLLLIPKIVRKMVAYKEGKIKGKHDIEDVTLNYRVSYPARLFIPEDLTPKISKWEDGSFVYWGVKIFNIKLIDGEHNTIAILSNGNSTAYLMNDDGKTIERL